MCTSERRGFTICLHFATLSTSTSMIQQPCIVAPRRRGAIWYCTSSACQTAATAIHLKLCRMECENKWKTTSPTTTEVHDKLSAPCSIPEAVSPPSVTMLSVSEYLLARFVECMYVSIITAGRNISKTLQFESTQSHLSERAFCLLRSRLAHATNGLRRSASQCRYRVRRATRA